MIGDEELEQLRHKGESADLEPGGAVSFSPLLAITRSPSSQRTSWR